MASPSLASRLSAVRSVPYAAKAVCSACRWALNGSAKPTTTTATTSPFGFVNSIQKRSATHAAAGVANGAKNRPGRRLGVKRGDGEYVTPNTILLRQRGSRWRAGENAVMGRDFTICAAAPGWVRYYRDPSAPYPHRSSKARGAEAPKYIGVVLQKDDRLPYPKGMPRRRRLGLVAVPMADEAAAEEEEDAAVVGWQPVTNAIERAAAEGEAAKTGGARRWPWETYINTFPASTTTEASAQSSKAGVRMNADYSFTPSNYEIGRAAERAGIAQNQFRRSRWIAWRKSAARKSRNALARSARKGTRKGGAKKKAKQTAA